jgi:hypothetical protein
MKKRIEGSGFYLYHGAIFQADNATIIQMACKENEGGKVVAQCRIY